MKVLKLGYKNYYKYVGVHGQTTARARTGRLLRPVECAHRSAHHACQHTVILRGTRITAVCLAVCLAGHTGGVAAGSN